MEDPETDQAASAASDPLLPSGACLRDIKTAEDKESERMPLAHSAAWSVGDT